MNAGEVTIDEAASRAWDVGVIGAGPAGAVVAALLARAGARTLLINRDPLPRFKVCGGCLAPEGALALREIFGPDITRAGLPLARLRLCAAGRTIDLPIGPFTSMARRELDHALVLAALRDGASLCIARATVTGPGSVSLRTATHSRTLAPGLVVAADGLAGSSLSLDRRFDWIEEPGAPVGLGAVVPSDGLPVRDGTITMLCGAEGYVGLAPLADGSVSVGAALAPASLRHGPGPCLAGVARACALDPAPFERLRFRGTRPLTRERAAVEGEGVLVLGDAAGYVEPFTGEGMTWAILAAREAAPLALRALQGGARAGEWTARLHRLLAPRRRRCRLVTGALRRAPLLEASMSVATSAPALAAVLARWATSPPHARRAAEHAA